LVFGAARVDCVRVSPACLGGVVGDRVVNEAELVCEAVLDCLGPEVRIGVSDLVARSSSISSPRCSITFSKKRFARICRRSRC